MCHYVECHLLMLILLLRLMPLVECWCMHILHCMGRSSGVEHTTSLKCCTHNVTCYIDSIVSRIHVNTTKPRNITCTLVSTGANIWAIRCACTHLHFFNVEFRLHDTLPTTPCFVLQTILTEVLHSYFFLLQSMSKHGIYNFSAQIFWVTCLEEEGSMLVLGEERNWFTNYLQHSYTVTQSFGPIWIWYFIFSTSILQSNCFIPYFLVNFCNFFFHVTANAMRVSISQSCHLTRASFSTSKSPNSISSFFVFSCVFLSILKLVP